MSVHDLELFHYSTKPLKILKSTKQPEVSRLRGKPLGLWVSVASEYDWVWWCVAENFSTERLKIETRVVLNADAKILFLETPEALDEITLSHGISYKSVIPTWPSSLDRDTPDLDWPRLVSEGYQGIVISPYQWSRRLDGISSRWYYGWDCSSGCIWDKRAIRETFITSVGDPMCVRAEDALKARDDPDADADSRQPDEHAA